MAECRGLHLACLNGLGAIALWLRHDPRGTWKRSARRSLK
jgi:hypothetical protein